MSEKVYSRITEAELIIKKLQEKYPDLLWAVRAENVCVLGIENKKRSKKNKILAKCIPIGGVEKEVLKMNNVNTRYIISLFWADWNEWSESFRQWLLLHELLHIWCEDGKTVKHDIQDFRVIVDAVGVNWSNRKDLPNLIDDDVKFNLDLIPKVEEAEEDDKEEKDE